MSDDQPKLHGDYWFRKQMTKSVRPEPVEGRVRQGTGYTRLNPNVANV
jgi:hypothetical protein